MPYNRVPKDITEVLFSGEETLRIREKLLAYGEGVVRDVFGLAREMVPYGTPLTIQFLNMSPVILERTDLETLTKTAALACSMAHADGRIAGVILRESPAVIDRIGFEGLRSVAAFSMAVAPFNRSYAARIVEESAPLADRLRKTGARQADILSVYRLAIRLAHDHWNLAWEWTQKSPDLMVAISAKDSPDAFAPYFAWAEKAVPFGASMTLAYLETAPGLIGRLGLTGAEPVWRCALTMALHHAGYATELLTKSTGIVDRLLIDRSPEQIESFFLRATELARTDAQLALKFAEASCKIDHRFKERDLDRLADTVTSIAEASRGAAVAFIDAAPALLKRTDLEGIEKIKAWGINLARTGGETSARFIFRSPDLFDRLGMDGLKMVADFSSSLSEESGAAAVQFLDKCPFILDGLLRHGDLALVSQVFHLGKRLIRYNARLALSLLDCSPALVALMGVSGLKRLGETARRLGTESWTTAVSLIEAAPRLIERAGFSGLERVAAVARHIARGNSYGAVSLLEKSPELMDRLLKHGDIEQALHLFELPIGSSPDNWRLATSFLDGSPEMIPRIGWDGLDRLFILMTQAAQCSGKMAKGLLDISSVVIDKMAFSGLEALAGFAAVLAAGDEEAAMDTVEKSLQLVDRLGYDGEDAIASRVYHLASSVARSSPRVAVRLLETSPALIHQVGLDGFGMIVTHVEAMARTDEAKALSFFASASPDFRDFMAGIPQGLELKDVKPVLAAYLKALLGRRVDIAGSPDVLTDGRRIYLPERIRDFQDNRDNFSLYKIAATRQEAHLEYGSYEFEGYLAGDLIRQITSRYGKEPSEKNESGLEHLIDLFPEPALAQDLFNLLEDFRIESILMREYPALGDEMVRMNRHMALKRRPPSKMANPKERTIEMAGQALMAHRTFDDPSDSAVPVLQRILERAHRLKSPGTDVYDTARAMTDAYIRIDETFRDPYRAVTPASPSSNQKAVSRNIGSFSRTSQQIRDRLRDHPTPPSNSRPNIPAAETQSDQAHGAAPTSSRPGMEQVTQRPHPKGPGQRNFRGAPGGGRTEESDAQPERGDTGEAGGVRAYDSEQEIERLLRAAYREDGVTPQEIEKRLEGMNLNDIHLLLLSLRTSLEKTTELQKEKGTSLYAEWGNDISDYRSNWTRIREQTHRGTSLDFYRETLDRYAGLLKKIRREFQMLKPEGVKRRKRLYDGDDIDLDAVVEFLVDRKAGLSPTEKYYSLVQRQERDIAVAFLVDMSHSTKGDTITKEKESLLLMSEALHEVGDAFAIYGFSGDNRDNVDFYRIKDFDDPYGQPVKKRISAIEDHFENRDGAAIRHTIGKLRRRTERTKLMILLSDGKPVDKDYSGAYAIEDTRMALKEAQQYGIKTFCITVDRAAADYLTRMYSHSRWTVIDDVTKLPEKITRIYRMLTA